MRHLEVKRFYDTFNFENMITNPPKLIQDFLDGEIRFIAENIQDNKTILEIGCGYGRLLEILAKKSKKAVGIDFSQKMVNLAKKKLSDYPNVEIFQMDANKLKFESGSFDYVVCLDNSFGNMPKIEEEVLREMKRVCKNNGQVIISVFSENARDSQIENYQRIGLKDIKEDDKAISTSEGFYSRRFTKKEIKGLYKKVGLKCKIIKICLINYIAISVNSKY